MYHHKPFSFENLTKAEKRVLRAVARPFMLGPSGNPSFVKN